MRVLVVDNYDSFVYNLVQYLGELGAEPLVYRHDELTLDEAVALDPDAVLISPGPGRPEDAGLSNDVIRRFAGDRPVLGVCLGHQCLGQVYGGDVVRVEPVERERDDAATALRRGPEDHEIGNLPKSLHRGRRELAVVGEHSVHAEPRQVLHRGAESHGLGDRHRAGFELPGQLVPLRLAELHFADHLAAAQEGRHLLQQLAPPPQRADAGRPEHLVAGEGDEVGPDRPHVHRTVGDALRGVDQHPGAGGMCLARDLRHRIDRAEHVGDVDHGDQLHAAVEHPVERLEVELAVGDRHVTQFQPITRNLHHLVLPVRDELADVA